jgi:ATP-dependent Clp protease protease subunit
MKTPNFRAEVNGKNLKLEIYDQIGPSWAGMIDAKSVSKAIADAGKINTIDVHINSPGGSVWEGLAIFNILKDHKAKVAVKVDGVAASSASVIAMAGDTISMPKNALMMIHNPWTFAMGYEDELRKQADVLGKHKTAIIETYLTKSTKSREEISQLMDDETWFTGDEAAEAGFADKVAAELPLSNAAAANEISEMFRHAPSNFSSLVALSMGSKPKEPEKMADDKTPEQIASDAKAEADRVAAEKSAADAQAKQADDVKNAAGSERKRAADIMAVCNQAGSPELAAEFIANGTELAEVQAHLLKVLCAKNRPVDDGQGSDPTESDENAAYKAEYATNSAAYKKAGMSEAEYVAMRRIDDGKEVLTTKSAG